MEICPSILIIDIEEDFLKDALKLVNSTFNIHSYEFKEQEKLLFFLTNSSVDIIVIDISLFTPKECSTFLGSIQQNFPHILLITIIPDQNTHLLKISVETEVFFYIKKPLNPLELALALNRGIEKCSLEPPRPTPVRKKKNYSNGFHGMVGKTKTMLQLFDLITRVAEDDFSTVLIRGESGTGKELVAKAIHSHSKRHSNNFVPVNCAAIPDDLLESELFGYTKGAFTGAMQNKQGRIQYADGGTLFLDEIGDMKPALQAKLLRVLQEKEFEPVGSLKATPVDTRVLAATHCDLEELVKEGKFREDLYYRLSVIPLKIPSLQERKQDIPLLLDIFIHKYTEQRGKEKLFFSDRVLEVLMHYDWRGNVRELENLVQHMSILYSGKTVNTSDLPEKFQHNDTIDPTSPQVEETGNAQHPFHTSSEPENDLSFLDWENGQVDFKEIINDFEKQLIVQAMKLARGNKKEAARILNLKRTTLLEKIKKKELSNLWDE